MKYSQNVKINTGIDRINKNERKLLSINIDSDPVIDLRFISCSSNHSLKNICDSLRTERKKLLDFFDDFQTFIHDFSNYENYSSAIKAYSSHVSGTNLPEKEADKLLTNLPEDVKKYARGEIVHLHLKRNGKGKALVFGFGYDGIFYIVAFDLNHEIV